MVGHHTGAPISFRGSMGILPVSADAVSADGDRRSDRRVIEPTTIRNVHVLGADEFHMRQLRELRRASEYSFHGLYRRDDVKSGRSDVVERLLPGALEALRSASPSPDAVVGYWDFPVSTMLPVLRRRLGHITPDFESVLRCEHKYWSRLEQSRSIPEAIPEFCAVDPFADEVADRITVSAPYWIKPVRSVLSYLGFRVDDPTDLEHAIAAIRAGIDRIAIPFDHLLEHADLPAEIVGIGGRHCIVESLISRGRQCTLEGYAFDDDITVYGAVDSIRDGLHGSSFSRYQYPSDLPAAILDRMVEITRRFLFHIGFTNSPFNAEFFWDDRMDQIWLLEINARISKSHAPLLRAVDGEYNYQVMVDIALCESPDPPHREGQHRLAAKFMWRCEHDAVVRRAPDASQVAEASSKVLDVELHVQEGSRLSELEYQESYSYELASIFVAGNDERELLEQYDECRAALDLRLDPV